jgi:hypothetical protein
VRCILCKESTEGSKSIEHIIPESLGNKEYLLPRGIVCDSCNNYFARKIEKPLLDLPYFKSARFRNSVENKKGRIPSATGILLNKKPVIVSISKFKNGLATLDLHDPSMIKSIIETGTCKVALTGSGEPPKAQLLMSRFIGKIAVEMLAFILHKIPGGIDEVIDNTRMDYFRNYVRYGANVRYWPYHFRSVYPENNHFTDEVTKEQYVILHSSKFIQSEDFSFLFVIEIFGEEYCIDMAEPSTTRYEKWLKKFNNQRPLEF